METIVVKEIGSEFAVIAFFMTRGTSAEVGERHEKYLVADGDVRKLNLNLPQRSLFSRRMGGSGWQNISCFSRSEPATTPHPISPKTCSERAAKERL